MTRRYRACRTGVEKTHWPVLWLLTRPQKPPAPAEVATQVGLSAGWVRAVLKRRNANGSDGAEDHLRLEEPELVCDRAEQQRPVRGARSWKAKRAGSGNGRYWEGSG